MAKRKTSMNGIPDKSLVVHKVAADALDLRGKRVAVVGGTDGLGRAIARLAAARGAEVLVVGRTFRDEGQKGMSFLRADLSSMKEAVRVGQTIDGGFDVVVLTTGIMAAKVREVTAEGIERDLAISTLSRFAILRELAPRLSNRKAGAKAPRVFVMGFPGAGNLGDPGDLNAEKTYDAMAAHMNTVAGNEAIVLDATTRYPAIHFFGLNPGLIKTNIRANYLGEGKFLHRLAEGFIGLLMQTPERYAAGVLPLLVAPELEGKSGVMFGKKGQPILPTDGFDAARVATFVRAMEGLLAKALG